MIQPHIAVFGAGLIGCYVGGRLASGGAKLTLIGRERNLALIRVGGLTVSDLNGAELHIAASDLVLTEDASALADADLILVTVKSLATEEAGAAIARYAKPGTVVMSLQNGVSNTERLQAQAPHAKVIAGMVPYNVAERGPGHFHQGTAGDIHVAEDPALSAFISTFVAAGMPLTLSPDMRGVLWGKLIINLNNAVNALSGKSLIGQISQSGYRRAVALSQFEALRVLRRAGIAPARVHSIPTWAFPWMNSLPDQLYRRLAKRGGAKIDKHARSSMAEDLRLGRKTEIQFLNGEIVALAARQGKKAPINARVVALIELAEAGAQYIEAGDLLADLKAVRR